MKRKLSRLDKKQETVLTMTQGLNILSKFSERKSKIEV